METLIFGLVVGDIDRQGLLGDELLGVLGGQDFVLVGGFRYLGKRSLFRVELERRDVLRGRLLVSGLGFGFLVSRLGRGLLVSRFGSGHRDNCGGHDRRIVRILGRWLFGGLDLGLGGDRRKDQVDLLSGVDGDGGREYDADDQRELQYGLGVELVHVDAHLPYRLEPHLVPRVEPLALRDDVTGLRVDGAKPTPNQGVHPVLGPEEGGEVGHEVEAEGAELLGEVGDVCRRHHVLPQVAQQAGHVGRRRLHDHDRCRACEDHPTAGDVRCPPIAHGLHARCLRSQA